MIVEVLRRNAKEINRKNSNRENVVELSWLFSNTPSSLSPVNGIQANQSLNPSILSPLPAIPSILWPAMFKEQLIHLFTQFKDKIQCIHTLSAFEWGDLAFHTGPIFWSGSLSPSCQLLLKSRQSFSKEDSGNCLSETNNCGRIEVPRLITSVGALPLLTGSIAVSTGATKDLSWTFAGNHHHVERKVFRQSPFSFQIWMSRLQCAEHNYIIVRVHFPEKQKHRLMWCFTNLTFSM